MIQFCNELMSRREGKKKEGMEKGKRKEKRRGKEERRGENQRKIMETCMWDNSTSCPPQHHLIYVQCHAKHKHLSLKSRLSKSLTKINSFGKAGVNSNAPEQSSSHSANHSSIHKKSRSQHP